MRAPAAPSTLGLVHPPRAASAPPAAPAAALGSGMTEVELTWIEKRLEQWIRFGRVAAERIVSRATRVQCFRPGATFAFVRWTANDFGTVHSSIAIIAATTRGEPYSTYPFVRPGGELLLAITGWPKVRTVLEAIDAIEAAAIDPSDVAPDHWRHIANHVVAGLPFRPYGADRHQAWLQRKALGR